MKAWMAALVAFACLLLVGGGNVLAGGSSDTSADVFHCYLFGERDPTAVSKKVPPPLPLGGKFFQFMVNDSDSERVRDAVNERVMKADDEGYIITASTGCLREDEDEGDLAGLLCKPSGVSPSCVVK